MNKEAIISRLLQVLTPEDIKNLGESPNNKKSVVKDEVAEDYEEGEETGEEVAEEVAEDGEKPNDVIATDGEDGESSENVEDTTDEDYEDGEDTEDSPHDEKSQSPQPMEEAKTVPEYLRAILDGIEKLNTKMEASLAMDRINMGISNENKPKKTVKEGMLVKIIGKSIKDEKRVFLLKEQEDGTYKFNLDCQKTVIGSIAASQDDYVLSGQKLPLGKWVICEGKKNTYLLSLDMFEEYTIDGQETNDKSEGEIIYKKGSAKSAKGYRLSNNENDFSISDNPKEIVCSGKFTNDCKYEVKGNIPEGKWVVIYNDVNDRFFLVNAEDVTSTVSGSSKKVAKKVGKKKRK